MDCASTLSVAEGFHDGSSDSMTQMQPAEHHHHNDNNNVKADKNNMVVETAIRHETVDNDEGITDDANNLDQLGGDAAVDNDGDNNLGGNNDNDMGDVDAIDIINHSLAEFLAKAQEEADEAAEVAAKKREEADAAETGAQEKVERMNILRKKAQTLADDEKWTSMYERLRVWSRKHGHCNPRRNWKSKIDAEEKGKFCDDAISTSRFCDSLLLGTSHEFTMLHSSGELVREIEARREIGAT